MYVRCEGTMRLQDIYQILFKRVSERHITNALSVLEKLNLPFHSVKNVIVNMVLIAGSLLHELDH